MKFNEILTLFESQIIVEGGAYGHMMHPIDNLSFTFGTLKDIINQILSGSLDMSEKTDGQNLMFTYKDGEVKAARNKTTLVNPMSLREVAQKFEGRGDIKDAFVNSMKDLNSAIIKLSDKDKKDIFANGRRFINMEIIYPPTKNVIDYGNRVIIQFHNDALYDDKGKILNQSSKYSDKLFKELEKKDALKQDVFEIKGPIKLKLQEKDFSNEANKFISELDKFMSKYGVSDNTTLREYYSKRWSNYIDDNLNIDEDVKQKLISRWVDNDKSVNLRELKKLMPEKDLEKFVEIDKNSGTIYKEFAQPLDLLFLKLGGVVLKNVTGFLAANPDESVKAMAKEINNLVKQIKSDKSADPKLLKKLDYQLNRLNEIGWENIAPLEGLVFKYGDGVYKLTGSFAPANQILGTIKFSR